MSERNSPFRDRPSSPFSTSHLDSPQNTVDSDDHSDYIAGNHSAHVGSNTTGRVASPSSSHMSIAKGQMLSSSVALDLSASDSIIARAGTIEESWRREKDMKSQSGRISLLFISMLYSCAVIGTSLRIFFDRLFGLDCESSSHDFDIFTTISRHVCVTASGTLEHGGALFVDLPTNMIGSFIMGLIIHIREHASSKSFKEKNRRCQRTEKIHSAVRVGLCGCLTTFASWNSQMILMIDGTASEQGSQTVSAIFGYIIGMYTAVASYKVGEHVASWIISLKTSDDSALKEAQLMDPESPKEPVSPVSQKVDQSSDREFEGYYRYMHQIPLLVALSFLSLFVIADGLWDISFYRKVWVAALLTIPGVHLRWVLSQLNGSRLLSARFTWIPFGTLSANVLGALVSITCLAIEIRLLSDLRGENTWLVPLVSGLKTGFAGSLSTVSSLVDESVSLYRIYPSHAKCYLYPLITITTSMVLGLCIYTPIVRST